MSEQSFRLSMKHMIVESKIHPVSMSGMVSGIKSPVIASRYSIILEETQNSSVT